jgi:hypothetical protein
MKLEKGNLVMYDGHQMTVAAYYVEDGIGYVDLVQGRGGQKRIKKVPAENVYFIAKKRSKYLN